VGEKGGEGEEDVNWEKCMDGMKRTIEVESDLSNIFQCFTHEEEKRPFIFVQVNRERKKNEHISGLDIRLQISLS